jgi:hypothetical protein
MRPEWGREMGALLGEVGCEVRWQGYEGLGHWWSEKEIVDLVGWLRGIWGVETEG